MAKTPVAGRVKTRLCPPLHPVEAARLARAALADTMAAALGSRARRRVLSLDGPPGPWIPRGIDVMAQRVGSFGERLAGAVEDAWATAAYPVLVVGMDTPQVDAVELDRAAAPLLGGGVDAVLGPAEDGGYWVIGCRRPQPGMFDEVPMSTAWTGQAQFDRLAALGLRCTRVASARDVDTIEDAEAVAAGAPDTRFAAVLRALRPRVITRSAPGGSS
jgi:rSAM/selenodomain-associated transferase 1